MILSASLASDRMPNILQWIQTIGRGQWDGHSLSSEWSSTTELHRIAIFRPRILQRGDMKLIKLCSTWRVIALLLLGSALLGGDASLRHSPRGDHCKFRVQGAMRSVLFGGSGKPLLGRDGGSRSFPGTSGARRQ